MSIIHIMYSLSKKKETPMLISQRKDIVLEFLSTPLGASDTCLLTRDTYLHT